MKSSVRILAIALALAFLLLARSAFQDDTVSAAAIDIDDDGEAAFADFSSTTLEAKYVGLGESGTSTKVVFYVNSEDLGTQVTASTTQVNVAGGGIVTLTGGSTGPSTINGLGDGDSVVAPSPNEIISALDLAYCTRFKNATTTINRDGATVPVTFLVPGGWGLASSTSAYTSTADAATACNASGIDTETAITDWTAETIKIVLPADRVEMATPIRTTLVSDEENWAKNQNHALYEYKNGSAGESYSKINPALRYTHGVLVGADDVTVDPVGGPNRPLASVVAKKGDGTALLTFITNDTGNEFQSVSDSTISNDDDISVSLTYDIVDVYEAADGDDDNTPYPDYSSGHGRALVTGSSDSRGAFVDLVEVTAVGSGGLETDKAPATNVFRGVVNITNVPGQDSSKYVYVQDGDTLTLTVLSKDGDRNSDALATVTALVDNSPPTISDLSPADKSVSDDDSVAINFTINDSGAGLKLDGRGNVKSVNLYKRDSEGDSMTTDAGRNNACDLAKASDSALTPVAATKNSVSLAFSPSGVDYSDCAVVDTTSPGKNSHGSPFNLEIQVEDLAGNLTTHTTQLTVDTEPPATVNAQAGKGWDSEDNKVANSGNSIIVKFDESLDVDTVTASDVTVAGYTVDSVEVVGVNAEKANEDNSNQNKNEYVHITLTEDLAKNASPNVTISGVADVAGNDSESQLVRADNKIAPVVTVTPFAALVGKDGEQVVSFTTDEALRASSGGNDTKASVNGDDSTLSIKVSSDTMGGSGTFEEDDFSTSRAYGVMVQAVDVNGNATPVGAVKVTGEDVSVDSAKAVNAEYKVKLENWPPADAKLDGTLQGDVIAYVGENEVASSTASDHDWVNGKVNLKVGKAIGEDDSVTVNYSYVNSDQVIQVDVTKPSMRAVPANKGETDYAATAVQFIWSDAGWKEDDGTEAGKGEYAGDTYKTVSLNAASHEGPDGESKDILDLLTTNDNKRWVFRPAADMALGAHKFTLEATDAAGNNNEVSTTFTVKERKPVEIDLSPGWNQISFRGTPDSLVADDLFGETISVVTQYDGRRVSPWTVWTRGSDGSFMSSPAGRTTIDPGLGLYVLSTDGSPLEVDIPGTSRDDPAQVPPSISLIAGWNMVAVIIINRAENTVGANEYLPAGVWTRAFRLNSITGLLESISPIVNDDDEDTDLNAGEALWVYAAKVGVIVPK